MEMEKQLVEAGTRLVDPPPSVDELLNLLDRVECCLSRVEQSPTKSMQIALSPSSQALIADKLMRHPDVDVRVAAASCISEIMRITAPDPPYEDAQMKEVFQLIVSSLENLHDMSSRSYTNKRTSILKTLAAVRSCILMLDLNCDSLIVDMFRHFFQEIREYHPENILSSVETIMTLVVEESDDPSLELISPVLASSREDNKGVSPTARKLGERVLMSYSTMLKLHQMQVKKTLEMSGDDYNQESARICREKSGGLEKNDKCASSEREDESKPATTPAEESMQVPCESAMNIKHLETISLLEKEVAACGERVLRLRFEVEISRMLVEKASYMFFLLVLVVLVVIFVK